MPADWQLPAGVSHALWDYFHDPAVARDYDRALADTPLLATDQAFVFESCQPPGKIADLGAGTGRLALALAQRGYTPIAIDLSPEMLRVARAKATALGLDIPCVCANLVELAMFADQSFDHAACLFSTLGLIVGADARRQFLAHVQRMLKPGGIFVVHVHNRWFNVWTSRGRRLLFTDLMRGAGGDYAMPAHQGIGALTMHLFTRREIVRLLRGVGFEIVEVRPLSLRSDGRLRASWWFGGMRAYGYLVAARKPS
jgi:ubiquinone/menaquinone biosynthesis C-methylase UbiE